MRSGRSTEYSGGEKSPPGFASSHAVERPSPPPGRASHWSWLARLILGGALLAGLWMVSSVVTGALQSAQAAPDGAPPSPPFASVLSPSASEPPASGSALTLLGALGLPSPGPADGSGTTQAAQQEPAADGSHVPSAAGASTVTGLIGLPSAVTGTVEAVGGTVAGLPGAATHIVGRGAAIAEAAIASTTMAATPIAVTMIPGPAAEAVEQGARALAPPDSQVSDQPSAAGQQAVQQQAVQQRVAQEQVAQEQTVGAGGVAPATEQWQPDPTRSPRAMHHQAGRAAAEGTAVALTAAPRTSALPGRAPQPAPVPPALPAPAESATSSTTCSSTYQRHAGTVPWGPAIALLSAPGSGIAGAPVPPSSGAGGAVVGAAGEPGTRPD